MVRECPVLSLSLLFQGVLMIDVDARDWGDLRLPEEHIPYFFRNNPDIKQECQQDDNCPYKAYLDLSRCWGYEETCPFSERMSMPVCAEDDKNDKREPRNILFWKQTDFGYVKERGDNLVTLCKPQQEGDSSLKCVDQQKYCRGTNLYIDLRQAGVRQSTDSYREDILQPGHIGGHCALDQDGLQKRILGNSNFLQSWSSEMQHFTSLPYRPLLNGECDAIIDKPTFIIKPDTGANMYHHFCDFINLYVSQHLNNSFNTDVNIFLWHTSMYNYGDLFKETWGVFTDNALLLLRDFDGKRVCFKDAVFSFLARMPLGLYYALRPVEKCEGSGLMRAFSQHTLYRLGVKQEGPLEDKIRVTFLSRSTKYRNIRNEEKIVSKLKSNKELEVKMVNFNRSVSFLEQLKISHNTDILLGIHGAGLTHMLFLPDWAAVFEIHNCEDPQCYLNLARIRGVKYITWENPDMMKTVRVDNKDYGRGWAKFVDYIMDENETLRLVQNVADHVTSHPSFLEARAQKYGSMYKTKGEL